jgi:hypothetical protein
VNQLKKAVKLAALGLRVFPCREVTELLPDGTEHPLRKKKSPYTSGHGHLDSSVDKAMIEHWWRLYPDALVGIAAGASGLICLDVDLDEGVDGQYSLDEAGVEQRKTLEYQTVRGGYHYIYRDPGNVPMAQSIGYRLADGSILLGVDRKAGSSYFIWWGAVPKDLSDVAPAPEWLLVPKSDTDSSPFDGAVQDWYDNLTPGKMDSAVREAIDSVKPGQITRSEVLRIQTRLARLGAEGHPGVSKALNKLRVLYLVPPWTEDKYREMWDKLLVGAIKDYGGKAPGPAYITDTIREVKVKDGVEEVVDEADVEVVREFDEEFEKMVLDRYRAKKADLEAARLIASDNYHGTTELSWDDMEQSSVEWLVEDLVATGSVNFLVAKRNMGKTFAYIDMICSMSTDQPWLGKWTRPARTLVVLGEGRHGFIDRIKAWCEDRGVDPVRLQEWIFFVDGANLNNDISVTRIKETAQRIEAELLIFDTYAAVSGVESEDDAALASITLNRAKTIMPEAAILFMHHPRKSDEEGSNPVMRGSGALAGAADCVMTLFKHKFDADDGQDEKWIALSTDGDNAGKNRHAKTEVIFGLYLKDTGDSAVFSQANGQSMSIQDRVIKRHLTGSMTVKQFTAQVSTTDDGKVIGTEASARRYLQKSELVGSTPGRGQVPETFYLLSQTPIAYMVDEAGNPAA